MYTQKKSTKVRKKKETPIATITIFYQSQFFYLTYLYIYIIYIYYPNEDLPLDVLTYKCVMLLALASMQRVLTLHSIEINNILFCYGVY